MAVNSSLEKQVSLTTNQLASGQTSYSISLLFRHYPTFIFTCNKSIFSSLSILRNIWLVGLGEYGTSYLSLNNVFHLVLFVFKYKFIIFLFVMY